MPPAYRIDLTSRVQIVMQLRARVWPVLLGVEPAAISRDEYMHWAHGRHLDSSVVDVDVQRSLWSYTEGVRSLWVSRILGILINSSFAYSRIGLFCCLLSTPKLISISGKPSHGHLSGRVIVRCRMDK